MARVPSVRCASGLEIDRYMKKDTSPPIETAASVLKTKTSAAVSQVLRAFSTRSDIDPRFA